MINALVTGSQGFIAKNFIHQNLNNRVRFLLINKKSKINSIKNHLSKADLIFHFAGTNRSEKKYDFYKDNVIFTTLLVKNNINNAPIVYLSSVKFSKILITQSNNILTFSVSGIYFFSIVST